MKVKVCCICQKDIIGQSYSPWPVKAEGRCCEKCEKKLEAIRLKYCNAMLSSEGIAARKVEKPIVELIANDINEFLAANEKKPKVKS